MGSFPTRVVQPDRALTRFGTRAEELLDGLWRADPLADEVVEDFSRSDPGEGFQRLDHALREGVDRVPDAPASLRRLFEQIEHPPDWVDWDRIERAGRVFFRSSVAGGIVLGAKSLALGYCSPAGNKALVHTGRLTHDMSRRIGETGRFAQATCDREGLRRDQPGFAITVKVRVMHAQVRRLIHAAGRWDNDAWGAPINQHDMVATMLLFSLVFIDGVRQFGVRVGDAELEDYLHLWRYSAFLMGVEPRLLPTDEEHARELEAIIFSTQGPPDEDSRRLVRGLVEAPLKQATTEAGEAEGGTAGPLGVWVRESTAWGPAGGRLAHSPGCLPLRGSHAPSPGARSGGNGPPASWCGAYCGGGRRAILEGSREAGRGQSGTGLCVSCSVAGEPIGRMRRLAKRWAGRANTPRETFFLL